MEKKGFNPRENEFILNFSAVSMKSSLGALAAFNIQVELSQPSLEVKNTSQLKEEYDMSAVLAKVIFHAREDFVNFILLEKDNALLLGNLVMLQGELEGISSPPPDVDDEVIREVLSIMLGNYATSLADYLQGAVEMEPPAIERINIKDKDFSAEEISDTDGWAVLSFPLVINEKVSFNLLQLIPYDPLQKIIAPLLPAEQEGGTADEQQVEEQQPQEEQRTQGAEEAPEGERQETPEGEQQPQGIEETPEEGQQAQRAEETTEEAASVSPAEKDEDVAAPQDIFESQEAEEIDDIHKDALAEVGNISMGSAATALSQLVNKRIQITTPQVTLTTMGEIREKYPIPCLVIIVNYLEGLEGENMLVVKEKDALTIAGLMMGMEPPDLPQTLSDMELSALTEAMNQMMGSASTAMSDFLNRFIEISPPQLSHINLETDSPAAQKEDGPPSPLQGDALILKISFRIEIEDLVDSELLQLVPLYFAREIASSLFSNLEAAGEEAEQKEAAPSVERHEVEEEEEEHSVLEDLLTTTTETTEKAETTEGSAPSTSDASAQDQRAAPSSRGQDLLAGFDKEEIGRLDLIKDIPVEISVIFGKTRIPLKKVFSLYPGEVVGLERYVGEPVELFANKRLVAKGEVVLVNGSFGIKVTEIIRSHSLIER